MQATSNRLPLLAKLATLQRPSPGFDIIVYNVGSETCETKSATQPLPLCMTHTTLTEQRIDPTSDEPTDR